MSQAVEAFRQISWIIVKWILWSVLILIVLGVLIGGGAYFYNWYTHDRHLQNVSIIVTANNKDCPDDKFPIRVAVINRSSRTIEHVTYDLAARVPGRSTNITKYHDFKDDHIIEPSTGWAVCWSAPELSEPAANVRSLEWSIKYRSVTFRD